MKFDKDKVEAQLNEKYFDCKVDLVPVSLKETYSDLVSKNPVLVSRELIVDDRPLIGIEYAPDGEVASVYTIDSKGKRVNFENTAEQTSCDEASNQFSIRLAEVKETLKDFENKDLLAHECKHVSHVARPRTHAIRTVAPMPTKDDR